MKRFIITVLLASIVSVSAFELKQLLGLDLGLTARNASATGQYSSIRHSSASEVVQDTLSAVPLSVNMSVQSADSSPLLSVELIALVVVALGLLTAAAIVWDGRPVRE